jgi:hypothetical protein
MGVIRSIVEGCTVDKKLLGRVKILIYKSLLAVAENKIEGCMQDACKCITAIVLNETDEGDKISRPMWKLLYAVMHVCATE